MPAAGRDMLRVYRGPVPLMREPRSYLNARVTQVFAEVPVFIPIDDNARVSQVFVEVPMPTPTDDNVRVSQVFMEVPVA